MKLNVATLEPRLKALGVLPVVTVSGIEAGRGLADALIKGGLPAIEVTLRVDGALEIIRDLAKHRPDMTLGAGTVRNVSQARECLKAGASFLVSPGFVPDVAKFANDEGMAYLPGVATPTEMEMAYAAGLSLLKLFPAEVVGGRGMLAAAAQALAEFRFVPTGGVNLESMPAYLALPNVVAVGGSWIASNKDIKDSAWDDIAANASAAVQKAQNLR
jgi:2-dehydro-3-deoxyphosphogluconate aldolase / (4S)-4-hydroxy-2-oxoglutarate aldolase